MKPDADLCDQLTARIATAVAIGKSAREIAHSIMPIVLAHETQARADERAKVAEEIAPIAREMQEMVNSAVTRHYASRIRVALGEPSTCACFACVPATPRGGA